MAAFATFAECESRVRTLMEAGTIVQGHACRLKDGTLAIRIQRYMSASGATADGMSKAGAWDVLTDDTEV